MSNVTQNHQNRIIAINQLSFSFLVLFFVSVASLNAQNTQNYLGSNAANRAPFLEQATKILESVPLIDGHNDVPIQYRIRAQYKLSAIYFNNTSLLERPMHTDIPRMRAGRVGGQFWSVYVPTNVPESESVQMTLEQIDFVYRLIDAFHEHFENA